MKSTILSLALLATVVSADLGHNGARNPLDKKRHWGGRGRDVENLNKKHSTTTTSYVCSLLSTHSRLTDSTYAHHSSLHTTTTSKSTSTTGKSSTTTGKSSTSAASSVSKSTTTVSTSTSTSSVPPYTGTLVPSSKSRSFPTPHRVSKKRVESQRDRHSESSWRSRVEFGTCW